MEYHPGGDLHQAILKGQLTREQALDAILSVSAALGHAHARGLVHRDVKPSNILLDRSGTPKLTDFDLVGAADTTGGTRTGALGTVLYAPPELLHNPANADARADVFSLGMTTVFCIRGSDLSAEMLGRPDELIQSLPCEDAVKVVLTRATQWKDVAARFPNASAFGQALASARKASVASIVRAAPAISPCKEDLAGQRVGAADPAGERKGSDVPASVLSIDEDRRQAVWREETEVRDALGKRVRELRHARQLTVKAASQQMRMHWRHLQKLEAGQVSVTMDTLARVANVLEVSVDALFKERTKRV